MSLPAFFAFFSILLAFCNAFIYVRSVLKGRTRPHAFTWGIWALISGVTFMAQHAGGGGAGAWLQGYNVFQCGGIMLLALRHGDRGYARSDWLALGFSLLSIPLWVMTGTPLWSVILLCAIDGAAFYPTFRKSWGRPFEEPALPYILWAAGAVASIAALERVSFITAAYPAFLSGINMLFVGMLFLRRKKSGGPGI